MLTAQATEEDASTPVIADAIVWIHTLTVIFVSIMSARTALHTTTVKLTNAQTWSPRTTPMAYLASVTRRPMDVVVISIYHVPNVTLTVLLVTKRDHLDVLPVMR